MPKLAILSAREQRDFDGPARLTRDDRARYIVISRSTRPTLQRTKQPAHKIGFLLQWAHFQASARFYAADQFKPHDIAKAKRLLGLDQEIPFTGYNGTVVSRHRERILTLLDWQQPSVDDKIQWAQQALRQATHQDQPKDILRGLVDLCWKHQRVIPSYHELSELITHSYNSAEERLLAAVAAALTPDYEQRLQTLLEEGADESDSTRSAPIITAYKAINHSLRPQQIQASVAAMEIFQSHYRALSTVYNALQLSDKATRFYADWVAKADHQQLMQFKDPNKRYLYLLGFIQHHYFMRQDTLVDTLLKSVASANTWINGELAVEDKQHREARDQAVQALSVAHKSSAKLARDIAAIVNHDTAVPSEKYYKIERLIAEYQDTDVPETVEVEQWEEQLSSTSQNTRFHALLRQRSIKLQNRVSAIVKALDFDTGSDAPALLAAIEHFKTTEGRVSEQPPVGFLTTGELEAVQTGETFDTSLYKRLLFIHIADAIKSGQLNLLHSYRFRAIQDYMIGQPYWDKNRSALLQEAGMEGFADGKLVLDQIKVRLQSRYKNTNVRFLAGDNPHMSVDKSGRCLVRTPKIESDDTSAISAILSEDGFVSIQQILSEVDRVSGYARCFKHLSPKHHKMKPTAEVLMAGLLSKGCNIGVGKLAAISSGIQEHILRNTVNWHFDLDNIRAANKRITDSIHRLALANNYRHQENVIHSSSDGRKVNVAVDCLHASYSFKYFGKDKGVTDYIFIDEREALFHSTLFSAADREAPYVIDGLVDNLDESQQYIHSTDTHGYTRHPFHWGCFCTATEEPGQSEALRFLRP